MFPGSGVGSNIVFFSLPAATVRVVGEGCWWRVLVEVSHGLFGILCQYRMSLLMGVSVQLACEKGRVWRTSGVLSTVGSLIPSFRKIVDT